ncbi:MAG: hypothetical protein ACRDD7_04170, partial [Peptostreptococcaceae bacterium]
MAKVDSQIIYYKGTEINKSGKNAVAYNIAKHMVEHLNYTYEQLDDILNNNNISVGSSELVKKKENISKERLKTDKDELGNSRARQRSYLPTQNSKFLKCKDVRGNIIEFGVWTEWEHKNFPKFKDYIEGLKLGYRIEEKDKNELNEGACDILDNNERTYENKELLAIICKYINNKGFKYDFKCIKNLYLSLKTKPFVILSGISGTGKSKLV